MPATTAHAAATEPPHLNSSEPLLTTTEPPHLTTEPLPIATEPPHPQPDAPVTAVEAVAPEPTPAEGSLTVKRRSVRLAAHPPGSADPAARDVKIKKLGMPAEDEDTKAIKKHQLLQAFTGRAGDAAEAAVQELLGVQDQAA
jgi:hypothetical protein